MTGTACRVDRPISVQVSDPASIRRYGSQPYTAQANPWVQRRAAAQSLAEALVADLATPQVAVTDLAIIADPRLQLGDLVRLVDGDGIAVDGDFWTAAIRDEYGEVYRRRIGARRARYGE